MLALTWLCVLLLFDCIYCLQAVCGFVFGYKVNDYYKSACVRWGNLFAVIAHRIWMIDLCFICAFSYFLYLI